MILFRFLFLYFIVFISYTNLVAQNFDNVYRGDRKCGEQEIKALLFLLKSHNNTFYLKYIEQEKDSYDEAQNVVFAEGRSDEFPHFQNINILKTENYQLQDELTFDFLENGIAVKTNLGQGCDSIPLYSTMSYQAEYEIFIKEIIAMKYSNKPILKNELAAYKKHYNEYKFTCGKLSSVLEENMKIIIDAPSINYVKQHTSEIKCLVEKNLEAFKLIFEISQPPDIEIYTKVGDEVVQVNKLRRYYYWMFTPKLDAIIEKTPLEERINLYDYSIISNALYLEYLYYGLFEEAKKLYHYDLFPSVYIPFLIYYDRDYRMFLNNAETVQVKATEGLLSSVGLYTLTVNDTIIEFLIEPQYIEKFREYLNEIGGVDKWETLLDFDYSKTSVPMYSQMRALHRIYNHENIVMYRFGENLYRYAYNLPKFENHESNNQVPDFLLDFELSEAEIVPVRKFVFDSMDKLHYTKYELFLKEIQDAGISGEILKCFYRAENFFDSNSLYRGFKSSHTRYFWYKSLPLNLEENLKKLPAGNPLHTIIGTALTEAPPDLKSAIKIIVENQ